jgi:ABC-type branched-subunit amino acid transport system ATPase component
MTDIDLNIDTLKKYFGGVKAVNGVSFSVVGNELIGLIGPNGSGKTTMINTINGHDQYHQRASSCYRGLDPLPG